MIEIEPRWFAHPVTKPGYGNPRPIEPVSTMDAPENVAACLSCPISGGCDTTKKECPLYGEGAHARWKRRKRGAGKSKKSIVFERENKVRDLINSGWKNSEAICQELHISKNALNYAKRNLRKRGEIK